MTPLVSVVMATFNGERFIREAIESVVNQTFESFEFIIVDDGSTDNTATLVKGIEDTRIKYIKKDYNSGISDSLNLGISKAKGKYIARMDDDDVCMPNRFEEQVAILEHNDNIVLCGTSAMLNNPSRIKVGHKNHEAIKIEMLFRNPIIHPTVMMRKEALLKHMYNIKKVPSEDYDLWSRLLCEGEFFNIEKPLLFYRYHNTSETSTRRKEQLQLNIGIAKFIFKNIGLTDLPNHDENISIFASHDYSISGQELRGLIKWFEKLKQINTNVHLFSIDRFNSIANANLEKFLISFFTNQIIIKKIIPFLYLNLASKKLIMNYYFSKIND